MSDATLPAENSDAVTFRTIHVWKDSYHYEHVAVQKPQKHLLSKRYYDADDVDAYLKYIGDRLMQLRLKP